MDQISLEKAQMSFKVDWMGQMSFSPLGFLLLAFEGLA